MAEKVPKKKKVKKAVKKKSTKKALEKAVNKADKPVKKTVKKKKLPAKDLSAEITEIKTKKKSAGRKKASPAESPVKNRDKKSKELKKDSAETEESSVEAAKYYPPQATNEDKEKRLKHFPADERKEDGIEERYYDNKLTLMARDPYWCYAYWDISPDLMKERAQKAGSDAYKLVLRVYDVTDVKFNGANAHKYIDIYVSGDASNWYINVWAAGRTYIADLGLLTDKGDFIILARSNAMSTPSDKVSDIEDEEWMAVDEDFDEIFRVSSGTGMQGSSDIVRGVIDMGSDIVSSFSSAELVKPKGFFLVADTELILYGATEKDAELKVKNEKINLNSDGTFSMRFHLNEGLIGLPVEATSKDGTEKITIKISVERKTE